MLNKGLESMVLKNSIQEKSFDYLKDIKVVNDFIKSVEHCLNSHTIGLLRPILNKNYEANDIFIALKKNKSQDALDKFLSFWAYESCLSYDNVGNIIQPTIFYKFDFLAEHIDKDPVSNAIVSFADFENVIGKYSSIQQKYIRKEEEVIIVTAVPVEFIAIVRKLSLFLTVSDKLELERILNPDFSLADKNTRKSLWVSGVLFRDDKWVKIMILLVSEYGSVSVATYLPAFKNNYKYRNEILLIGIAGQLEKTSEVKVGHLVISDGFYDAYHQKIDNTGVNFQNIDPIPLCDNYDFEGFSWSSWGMKYSSTEKPNIPEGHDTNRYCYNKTVHKGKFVSFHAVNKQKDFKGQLLTTFKESMAVEMEGTGCHKFIKSNQPHLKLKIIKAVCDWSDESKSKEWQPYCAEIAAEFTVDYLISKYGKNIE